MRATVIVFVALCLACGGLGGPGGARPPRSRCPAPASPRPHVQSRDEFKKEFMGATLDEVRAKLGAPDLIESWRGQFSDGHWAYRGRTPAEDGMMVYLRHRDGRVVEITW